MLDPAAGTRRSCDRAVDHYSNATPRQRGEGDRRRAPMGHARGPNGPCTILVCADPVRRKSGVSAAPTRRLARSGNRWSESGTGRKARFARGSRSAGNARGTPGLLRGAHGAAMPRPPAAPGCAGQTGWPMRAIGVAHRCLPTVPFAPLSWCHVWAMIDRMVTKGICHVPIQATRMGSGHHDRDP